MTEIKSEKAEAPAPDDWDARQLCADGNCIGVIGPDGRCSFCGRQAEGGASEAKAPGPAPEPSGVTQSSDALDARKASEKSAIDAPDSESFDEAERKLCPDESCIGVLGQDGTCKICGKSCA